MKNYIIITGCSQGLGAAIAEHLLKPNNYLICISRSPNTSLITAAKNKNNSLQYIQFDLNNIQEIEKLFSEIFSYIDTKNAQSIHLINNAGIVNPISTAREYNYLEVSQNININLTAPMLTTSEFIKRTHDLNIEKRVINISSGAATNAVHGWGAYCASKAGLNIYSKCVAIEQASSTYPIKIYAVRPGIIDTEMQANIRNSSKDNFADVEKFINYKQDGVLKSPDYVALKVIDLLTANNFENGDFINIGA